MANAQQLDRASARARRVPIVVLVFTLIACSGSGATQGAPARGTAADGDRASKTLTIGLDEDLRGIWNIVTEGGGGSEAENLMHAVHQPLAANTADGSADPRALAELPSFERGTWRLLDDGTMQTTWKLRTSARWHDGTPLSVQDVLFSYRVYRDPEIANSRQNIVKLISGMEQRDAETVLATWAQAYPYANRVETRELLLLPAHILEPTYNDAKDRLLAAPYFSTAEYVGLGPYRVTNWVSGSHVELTAFDQFFLGRPKIDRVFVRFIPDSNTLLANLKAGSVQLTLGSKKVDKDALRTLKEEWEAAGRGRLIVFPDNYKFAEPQKRLSPQPADLADVRVRRALLYAIDRQALVNTAFEGHGVVADGWVNPSFHRYQAVKDWLVLYPYNARQASALLEEVGWQRGADGILQKQGQRFSLAIRDFEGEKQPLIVANDWRQVGIEATYEYRSPEQLQDRQDRATFTGITMINNNVDLVSVVRRISSANIPTAENRWTGTNRGGYANPRWDEIGEQALATLDEGVRLDLERQLLNIFTTDLPLLPLFYQLAEIPAVTGFSGLAPQTGLAPNSTTLLSWNIHEWDLQ
jgi:peptide/nickel transport system substrate-binding protein